MRYANRIFSDHHRHLRFRQWSRKGYAVFYSLGRVVHINRLSVALSQWIGKVIQQVDGIYCLISLVKECPEILECDAVMCGLEPTILPIFASDQSRDYCEKINKIEY